MLQQLKPPLHARVTETCHGLRWMKKSSPETNRFGIFYLDLQPYPFDIHHSAFIIYNSPAISNIRSHT